MTVSQGLKSKDQGVADVLAADVAANRGYAEYVRAAVNELIDRGEPFTADDVRALIPEDAPSPHSSNVLPAVIAGYARRETIRRIGDRLSTRRSRRAGRAAVWLPILEASAE